MNIATKLIKRLKQAVDDTKLNIPINKQYAREHFINKINLIELNEQFVINNNDLLVLNKFSNKKSDVKVYILEVLNVYYHYQEIFNNSKFSDLGQIYHSQYNFLINFNNLKYKHIFVPSHIEKQEQELIKSVEIVKNLLLHNFSLIRQLLQTLTEVYYKQPYCNPQYTFRQLESLEIAEWEITEEHIKYADGILNEILRLKNKIDPLLELIAQQLDIILIYYEDYIYKYKEEILKDNFLSSSHANEPYADLSYSYSSVHEKTNELFELKKILTQNKN